VGAAGVGVAALDGSVLDASAGPVVVGGAAGSLPFSASSAIASASIGWPV
jgi:hypothetical protein